MRVKVIVPLITDSWNRSLEQGFQRIVSPGLIVEVGNLAKGPASIECQYDEDVAAPFLIQEVQAAETVGYKGVLVFCFGNTGVEGARECVDIPVVGIGQAAQLIAMSLGDRFSILSTIPNSVPRHWRKAEVLGTRTKLVSIRPINIPVLGHEPDAAYAALRREGDMALADDGAEVLVLGCGTMLGYKERLEQDLGVPVVDAALAGIKFLEALLALGLSHSKKSFMRPPDKQRLI